MNVVSQIENWFLSKNLIKDYTSILGEKYTEISLQILSNVNNTFYLPQNSLLDNSELTGIEFVSSENLRYTRADNSNDYTENISIAEASLYSITFSLSKNDESILEIPLVCASRFNNNGKICFINSKANNHRIGDSSINIMTNGFPTGKNVTLRFYYK